MCHIMPSTKRKQGLSLAAFRWFLPRLYLYFLNLLYKLSVYGFDAVPSPPVIRTDDFR